MERPEKKKKKGGGSHWPEIEFLRRLPLKSLFKFKIVCKRWLCLISDPSMPRLYLGPTGLPNFTLLCQTGHSPDRTIESHPDSCSVNSKLGFSPKQPQQFRIVAADKGLLLSYELTNSLQAYYVSNPLTGNWTALPEPPTFPLPLNLFLTPHCSIQFYEPRAGSSFQPRAIGFIAGPIPGFKVIWIQDFDHDRLRIALFDSSRGNYWTSSIVTVSRPVQSTTRLVPGDGARLVPGVVYNAALHWAVDGPDNRGGRIIVYDPKMHISKGDNYQCRVFDLAPQSHSGEGVLGLSGGEIRYANFVNASSSRTLFVWKLSDYESGDGA